MSVDGGEGVKEMLTSDDWSVCESENGCESDSERVRVRVRNRSSFAARATLLGALFAGAAGAMHM